MGATVTTRKLAAAFREPSGGICYILFEETYEKNCYPHTPNFSCYYIGNIKGALERIFLGASSCEGGALQGRNGHLSPEGYVAGWLKELACPVAMYDATVRLTNGKSFYSAINDENRDKAISALRAVGRDDLAGVALAGGESSLSLWANAPIVRALHECGGVSAWRLIGSHCVPLHHERDASLGYAPKSAKGHAIPSPKARRPGNFGEHVLIQGEDGAWRSVGWAYSVVGSFIREEFKEELRVPGGYRKRIKAFRDAITAAPAIDGALVTVDRTTPPLHDWQVRTIASIPNDFPGARAEEAFFVIPMTRDNCYSLCSLPPEVTTWSFLEHEQPLQLAA